MANKSFLGMAGLLLAAGVCLTGCQTSRPGPLSKTGTGGVAQNRAPLSQGTSPTMNAGIPQQPGFQSTQAPLSSPTYNLPPQGGMSPQPLSAGTVPGNYQTPVQGPGTQIRTTSDMPLSPGPVPPVPQYPMPGR